MLSLKTNSFDVICSLVKQIVFRDRMERLFVEVLDIMWLKLLQQMFSSENIPLNPEDILTCTINF